MANSKKERRELKELAPFSWLSEEQLDWALPTVQHRRYAARTTILRTGAPTDGLYIVLSGRVYLLHEDINGRHFIAGMVRAHDFFGEMGLFEGEDSIVSFYAREACEVLYIPRAVVLECLKSNPEAAMCMLAKISRHLVATHRRLAQFAVMSVHERVSEALLEHAVQADKDWVVAVGSEQLAGLVGSSREMVSRVIKGMIEQGTVRRRGRTLIVLDRRKLETRVPPR
jgi:CRP/FNR family cyclic AMP-dependent transcriptional regulator